MSAPRHEPVSAPPTLGRVVRVEGPVAHVEIDCTGHDGVDCLEVPCRLRGTLRRRSSSGPGAAVVGDRVEVELGGVAGTIVAVRERVTVLSRPGFRGTEQVLAANMDQVLLVVSAREPDFKPAVVDRLLVHARRGGAPAHVVLTKSDLAPPGEAASWSARLRPSGVDIIVTSCRTGAGIEELRRRLSGKLSVLVGQSGVGKSSLLNALVPELLLRTQTLSARGKGRHTTTTTATFRLPGGGRLVDTPGVKTLAMWDGEAATVASAFPDIEDLARSCRFGDCGHDREPGCAVRRAAAEGLIEAARYESFRRLRAGR